MNEASEQGLKRLREGNERFVRGESAHVLSTAARQLAAERPQPWAVLAGCSDSRVPPEIIFDVGVGDAVVVRASGNVLSESGLASVRFGVEQWGVPLVVVLGHEDCSVVCAAMHADTRDWLLPILDYIETDVEQAAGASEAEKLAVLVEEHVRATVIALDHFLGHSSLPDGGSPAVVGAIYRMSSGEVRWL